MNFPRENQKNGTNNIQPNISWYLKILLYTISFSLLPLTLSIGVILTIYRQIVHYVLKLKYKENYAGLLSSGDFAWVIEDNTKNIVQGLLLVKYEKPEQAFFEEIKERIAQRLFNNPFLVKMTSTRHMYFGYAYLLKNQITISDCFKTIDERVNDEITLRDFVSDISDSNLPKSNTALFECYIGKSPIKWKHDSLYPIYMRLHHMVGDGATLLPMVREILLADTPNERFKPMMNLRIQQSHRFFQFYNILKNIMLFSKIIVISPVIFLNINYLRREELNKLYNKSCDGRKLVAWCNKDNGEVSQLCKSVRKLRKDIRMSDLICTAISASLREYFKRNKLEIPNYMRTVTPVLPIKYKSPAVKYELKNMLNTTFFDLAIDITPFSLVALLDEIRRHTEHMRKLPDVEVSDWFLNGWLGLVPYPLSKFLIEIENVSVIISNLPFSEDVETLNGCSVEDIIVFAPNRRNIGVSYFICSYKSRFQFSLIVDRLLISSKEEVQIMVDDVVKNLKYLCDDILNEHKLCKKSL